MTEEECKKKLCPIIFKASVVDLEGNVWPHESKCIGSACMMFRSSVHVLGDGTDVTNCYCGLAGKV